MQTLENSRSKAGPGPKVREAIERLRAQRDEALQELLQLSEEDCRQPAQWGGGTRTVNFMLRVFAGHEMDHLQHATRLLRDRGWHASEAQMLLMRAQALRGETEALLLSLSDEEFEVSEEGAWSIAQVVEHLRETDRNNLQKVRDGIAAGSEAAAGGQKA